MKLDEINNDKGEYEIENFINLFNNLKELILGLITSLQFDLTYFSVLIAIISLLVAWHTLKLTRKSFESVEKSYEMTNKSLKLTDESLHLAKEMYILSSREFEPIIEFEIKEKSIKLINKTNDLFRIENIDIIGIQQIGFEYHDKPSLVLIPLVDVSKSAYIFKGDRQNKEFNLNFDEIYSLAAIRPLPKEKIDFINEKVEIDFGIDNDKRIGYATPSLQTYYYIIELCYCNNFNELKRLAFKQVHIHGIGEFKKIRINDEELQASIKQCHIPLNLDNDKLWQYVIKKYEQQW